MRKSRLLVIAPAAAVLVIAGCGGTGGSGYGSAAPSRAATSGSTVVLTSSKFGKILTDPTGRPLYIFAADKTTKSTCYGACASLWPPLTVTGAPTAGGGVSGALLATTKRTDGTTEVTYAGHPLYYYAPDTKAGDFTGQAITQFGAPWYVITGSGMEITHG